LLHPVDMKLRKLAFFGSVVAGVALLQNKQRRERLIRGATDFFQNARNRVGQLDQQGTEPGLAREVAGQSEVAGFTDPMSDPMPRGVY
jgi:hypothetical protein